jgi:hypothetical protein
MTKFEVNTVSESFTVKVDRAISLGEFLKIVNLPSFEHCSHDMSDINASMTGINHFYRDEASCRAIEIEFWPGDKTYSIKTNHPASKEDWMLVRHVTESLARHFGAEITGGDTRCALEQFSKKHDEQWASDLSHFGARALLDCAFGTGFAALDGAVRPFYFGERVKREVTSNHSGNDVYAELFRRIHETQYVGLEYFAPKHYEIIGTKKKFVVIGPDVQAVTPYVDFISFPEEGSIVFVPYAALPQIVGERLTWLDEKQALIDPIDESDWSKVLKIAKKHSVELQKDMDSGVGIVASPARLRYDRLLELAT